jgi:outer membrane murein-binding lipoprotein Lpp
MMNRMVLIAVVAVVLLAGCNHPSSSAAKSKMPAGSGTVATAQAGLPRMVELGAET